MPVPSTFADLSTTPASNGPAGSDPVNIVDDYMRSLSAFVASIYTNSGNGWASPYLPKSGGALSGNVTSTGSLTVDGALSYGSTLTGGTGIVNIGGGQIYKDATGFVGVGTSTPSTKVTVSVADGANAVAAVGSTVGGFVALRPDGVNGNAIRWGGSGAAADVFRFLATGDTERVRIDGSGNAIPTLQSTPPVLNANNQMVLNLTSDTNLRISVRGSDGVTRVANITLS